MVPPFILEPIISSKEPKSIKDHNGHHKKTRAENVRYLIAEKCSGNKSEFARRIGSSVQHVSKILRALDPDADQLKETAKNMLGMT